MKQALMEGTNMKRTRITLSFEDKKKILMLAQDLISFEMPNVSLIEAIELNEPEIYSKMGPKESKSSEKQTSLHSTLCNLLLWKVQTKIAEHYKIDMKGCRLPARYASMALRDGVISGLEFYSIQPGVSPRPQEAALSVNTGAPYTVRVKNINYFNNGSFCVSAAQKLTVEQLSHVTIEYGNGQDRLTKTVDLSNYKAEKKIGEFGPYYLFSPMK